MPPFLDDSSQDFYQAQVDSIQGYTIIGHDTWRGFPLILVQKGEDTKAICISRDPEGNGPGHFELLEVEDHD